MKLLVSIHDVAPPFSAEVETLGALCGAFGIVPALLVVPNWHGLAPLEEHPTFARWLRDRASDGADVLLHGERHDEVPGTRSWRDELRALGRTAREGEFLTLGVPAAALRIARGLAVLRGVGLDPVGFVPPAWLARQEHRRAVRQAGLSITEDTAHVWLTRHDIALRSPVIRWSARTAMRAEASRVVAESHDRSPCRPALLRVALHPRDLHDRVTLASIRRTLARVCRHRTLVSYAQVATQDNLGSAA